MVQPAAGEHNLPNDRLALPDGRARAAGAACCLLPVASSPQCTAALEDVAALTGVALCKLHSPLDARTQPTATAALHCVCASCPRALQVLRAHSVAILKYNSSHPRTDIHVDDGILAMTLALSPRANYSGGGTFFEHMGEENILEMDQGFCTIRPGSVRHGGHPVQSGDRYILGAFLLIADRVEHVRRLNSQGREARSVGDLRRARLLFKWAVKLNPKCATCLKNWGEALTATPDGSAPSAKLAAAAEDKIRRALELLPHDSDALFSLGALLSGMGRKDEAFEAYQMSLKIKYCEAAAQLESSGSNSAPAPTVTRRMPRARAHVLRTLSLLRSAKLRLLRCLNSA